MTLWLCEQTALLLLGLFVGNHVPLPKSIELLDLFGGGAQWVRVVPPIASGPNRPPTERHELADPAEAIRYDADPRTKHEQ
jgi:hypothetical protein